MSSNAMEKVISNVDLLIQIFNFLDLEDQFRLSRASAELKDVFETFIWKQRYTTLRVIVRPPYFVITNETDLNPIYLRYNQLKEFQRYYADEVEELTIKNAVLPQTLYDSWGFECDAGVPGLQNRPNSCQDQLDLRLFPHVTKLTCHHKLVELSYLNYIAECCPNLKELILIKFDYVFTYDELLSSLRRMKNLKVLYLRTFLPFPMGFRTFKGLLATYNLEQLHLSYNIDLSQIMMESQQPLTLHTGLKDLEVWTRYSAGNCHSLKFFCKFLGHFDQLTNLYLKLSSPLSDECLAAIAKNCKRLEKLTFKCAKFRQLENFAVPPRLTNLTLNWCVGLTCNNLRQILNQLNLKQFHSKNTNYVGAYDFRVSPHMISLSIDEISTHHFKPALESHANLQELSWFQHEASYDIRPGAALAAWANLETLDIRDCDVSFDTLRQLTKLKKVILPRRPPPYLTWIFVLELLKHPILEELILRYPVMDDVMNRRYFTNQDLTLRGAMNADVADAGFVTNLRRLEMTLEIFEHDAEFWIDLFRCNENLSEMHIIRKMGESVEYSVIQLVCGEKALKFLKKIDVCGMTINCRQFRRNFNAALAKLQSRIEDIELWNDNEEYFISLKRCYN